MLYVIDFAAVLIALAGIVLWIQRLGGGGDTFIVHPAIDVLLVLAALGWVGLSWQRIVGKED